MPLEPWGNVSLVATPKFEAPEFYWVVHSSELFNLVQPDSDLAEILKALAFYEDVILLDVENFCSGDQAIYVDLVIEDFEDGTYREKLRNASLQTVYYNLCEE